MAAKAFCYRDGTISISTDTPAIARAFLQGKTYEITQLLNIHARRSFYGVLSVPDVTGLAPAKDFSTLENFAAQLKESLKVYQAGNRFLSLEVLL